MTYLRRCNKCSLEAYTRDDLECFSKHPDARYGRRNMCKQCSSGQTTKYTEKVGKKQYRNYDKYGITEEEYSTRRDASTNCDCCGQPFKNSKTKHYDHCHETLRFRGVLCNKCNLGIGLLGDTEEGLLKALQYLTK